MKKEFKIGAHSGSVEITLNYTTIQVKQYNPLWHDTKLVSKKVHKVIGRVGDDWEKIEDEITSVEFAEQIAMDMETIVQNKLLKLQLPTPDSFEDKMKDRGYK